MRSTHLRDWVERARLIPVEDVAERLGLGLADRYGELVGACPVCGGTDRFVVSPRKQLFRCRKCEVAGDAIALVAHVEGLDLHRRDDFFRAVELASGESPPNCAPDPCESACKKDPLFGVIGFQSGPRHRGSTLASMILGSRGWDAGRGDDCKDPPRVF